MAGTSLPLARMGMVVVVLVAVWWCGLDSREAQAAGGVKTVAVTDFDNNTVAALGAIVRVDFLVRGLPEMLLAELSGVAGLKMVERVHLRQALEELKLGSGDLADPESRLKLGRILGANQMVFGSFMAMGSTIRIDVRVVDVSTTLVTFAEAVEGPVAEVTDLATRMAKKIATRMAGAATPSSADRRPGELKLWERYDRGIVLMDEKKFGEAVALFQEILKEKPNFKAAAKQIPLALERMARE